MFFKWTLNWGIFTIEMTDVLSMNIGTSPLLLINFKSLEEYFNHMTSIVAVLQAMYFASAVDIAVQVSSLLP